MRKENRLALLAAPVALVALLFLGEYGVQAAQRRYSVDRPDYVRSVAAVWALDSIMDNVSCRDSLSRYERDFRELPNEARNEIVGTYEDLAGNCDDNRPPRQTRDRAASFLRGMKVSR